MAVEPRERRFTVDEYYRMAEAGIIGRDERVELVEGRIIRKPPPLPRHSWCVIRISRHILRLADRMILSVKNPVRLDEASEPEPDLAVLRRETSQDRHPGPDDVLLMIEVADTSLAYDRGTKAPLYARHGIPELWIADLRGERIEAHREPSPSGYRVVRVYGRGETLAPAFAPDFALEVDAVLGPRTEA